MAARTHEQDLSAALLELADTLTSDYDVVDYLDRLLHYSCGVMQAPAGGVMLDNGRGSLAVMASTDERMRLLEVLEVQGDEGPCVDAYRSGERVVVGDLRGSRQWPGFTPMASERGIAAVCAFPLRWRDHSIGALNLFRDEPGALEPRQLQAAQALAQMAAIGILQERAVREARELTAQLQTALHSRIVIEQAKGILAERGGFDMGAAYEALRWYCRTRNLRLRQTAGAITADPSVADEVIADQRTD
ncbi:ANTAR domain-containing protein [Egibacter rhizosphaerae]|uniref:ANTAR domain-containing protein n=1 Tax=Egibacter rhizosphaerae TaxID=1670831 RepID=A0A411YKJ5_9ACTN|nr:GAF and ANTAR domain-containing protein [Egibacter rhizosphaerae]QBI21722.1 ANTAR domain-containing protein [Egibacter rhizosphaerae]